MLAMTWALSEIHGWGLIGVHISLYLQDRGAPPMLLSPPCFASMRPHIRTRLETLTPTWEHWPTIRATRGEKCVRLEGFDVIHAFGNNPHGEGVSVWGDRNIGMIVYETTRFDPGSLDLLRRMDVVICGSRYNETLLREAGLDNVLTIWQGIDPTETRQQPRRHRWGDRFVVFSGGKLEFRKGQDIVLAAFRRFQQSHPDALLVTAWHSLWPRTALTMAESTLLSACPEVRDGRVQIAEWAADNGVPPEHFVDLGLVSRPSIAEIMAECDVAVFPNRCEGGTNLVAMEALACGVATVVAANSGQLDLMGWGDICWPLTRQTPLADPDGRRRGWAQSDPEELVEAMETIYRHGAEVERRRVRAREVLQGEFTWRQFAEKLVAACEGDADFRERRVRFVAGESAPLTSPAAP